MLEAERPADAGTDALFLVLKRPPRGGPLSAKGLEQVLGSARERAGLSHVCCHELRHTCLTQLREAGMALEAVQAQAGHASIESTRIYLHLADDWLASQYRRAAESSTPRSTTPPGRHHALPAPAPLHATGKPVVPNRSTANGGLATRRTSRAYSQPLKPQGAVELVWLPELREDMPMLKTDSPTVRLVTDEERRARIGIRHALAGSFRVFAPDDVARSVVCLHATDPPSVHLSCWARSETVSVDDVERALYETRSLMRQQSMRETIFVFPRELVPAVWGSAAARVAAISRKRLIKDVERWRTVPEGEGAAWLHGVEQAVVSHLADGVPRSSKQLREEVPEAGGFIVQSPDKKWGGKVAIAPRVLAALSMGGVVARASNAGAWYTSRPLWTTTETWWGHAVPEMLEARQGFAELVDRWLWSYGPGTVEDIAWWLGNTKTTVQTALDDLGAVQVSLEDGSLAWLREDDIEPVTHPEPWVALLPLLDPTVMGWKKRDFFLGEHGPQLFDSAGNAGTTVWVDGRVVGVWVQDDDGVVQLRLLDKVTSTTYQALHVEAQRLTHWLDGQRVFTVYPSPAMQPRADRYHAD